MNLTDQNLARRLATDGHGRLIPMSEDDVRRRAGEVARSLDALDEIGDEQEQRETLDFLMQSLDEDRLSYRKRFP